MENKETLVQEESTQETNAAEAVSEQVEETAPARKTYTEDEVNSIVGKKRAIERNKIQKQYEKEYGELIDLLKVSTGKNTVPEIKNSFKYFLKEKGVPIKEKPSYSEKEEAILAKAEAEDIISEGYDEVVEEMERLSGIGVANMTAREKAVYKHLAKAAENTERERDLEKLGISKEVYTSKGFIEFADNFKEGTPIEKIYGLYEKQNNTTKEIKTMGSMKNSTASADSAVKEHYTFEEAQRFSQKDLDKNPALYEAIKRSMLKWK